MQKHGYVWSAKLKELGEVIDGGNANDGLLREIENDGKLAKDRISAHHSDENQSDTQTIKRLRKIVEFVRSRVGRIIFLYHRFITKRSF